MPERLTASIFQVGDLVHPQRDSTTLYTVKHTGVDENSAWMDIAMNSDIGEIGRFYQNGFCKFIPDAATKAGAEEYDEIMKAQDIINAR